MSVWLWAATVLLAGLVPCGVVMLRASILDALVALELAGVVTTLVLLLLAQGFGRSAYFVVPLLLAVLSFAGALVFLRFLERELP